MITDGEYTPDAVKAAPKIPPVAALSTREGMVFCVCVCVCVCAKKTIERNSEKSWLRNWTLVEISGNALWWLALRGLEPESRPRYNGPKAKRDTLNQGQARHEVIAFHFPNFEHLDRWRKIASSPRRRRKKAPIGSRKWEEDRPSLTGGTAARR